MHPKASTRAEPLGGLLTERKDPAGPQCQGAPDMKRLAEGSTSTGPGLPRKNVEEWWLPGDGCHFASEKRLPGQSLSYLSPKKILHLSKEIIPFNGKKQTSIGRKNRLSIFCQWYCTVGHFSTGYILGGSVTGCNPSWQSSAHFPQPR